ncbi:D-alanyl-D-alanine carboxypeptidase [Synechococcus sp. W60.2]|uniref:D-alanyl-D-alanine carboxypeptidase n=1 Tax=Synechococcus sp. W60.2 TaxID=2964521 RepID=UPI0039C0E054
MKSAPQRYCQRQRPGWRLVAIWGGTLSAAFLLLSSAQATAQGSLQPQVETYLAQLSGRGFASTAQGVWLQRGDEVLGQHQGSKALPAASLTKVATTLAALQQFGPHHRFVTTYLATGSLGTDGVLQGDLWVLGGRIPSLSGRKPSRWGTPSTPRGSARCAGIWWWWAAST